MGQHGTNNAAKGLWDCLAELKYRLEECPARLVGGGRWLCHLEAAAQVREALDLLGEGDEPGQTGNR